MPAYRAKQTYPAKKYSNRRKRPSRFKTYGRAGAQLYKDVMYLKGIINAEVKNHYVDINQNVISSGVVHQLSNISQGDDSGDRDGAKIFPRWLQVRGTLSNSTNDDTIRMIIFRWAENTTPSVGAVLEGTPHPHSYYDEDITGNKQDRTLHVLYDQRFNFKSGTESARQEVTIQIDINPPTQNRKVHIEYPASATSLPCMNKICMLLIGINAGGAGEGFSIIKTKLSFYDN